MSLQDTSREVHPGFTPALGFREPGLNLAGCLIQWNQSNGRALAQELQAIVGNSPTTFKTAAEFINGWLDRFNKSREKAAKTKKNYTSIVADLLAFLGPRAARPFGDFTTALVVEFRNAQRDEGKAPATVNKALSVVRQICDEAIAAGVLTEHPFAVHGMRITLPRNTKARKRKHFKFAQFRKLVKATEPGAEFKDGERLAADSLSCAATPAGDSKNLQS